MIGKLLRILTFNYFTLGWWLFRPKWKKEKAKMKGQVWHGRVLLRLRSLQLMKPAMQALKEQFPFLSPAELKWVEGRFRRHSQGRVYIYMDYSSWEKYRPEAIQDFFYLEHQLYDCCGTQWQDGDCGCVPSSFADVKLPVHPQPNAREVVKKPKIPK